MQKYEIHFTGKTTLFRRYFQTLNALAARATLSSNVHQFCIPKSSLFMRETAMKRVSMFYEVYRVQEFVIFLPFSLNFMRNLHLDFPVIFREFLAPKS